MGKPTSWQVLLAASFQAGLPLAAAHAADITVDESTCMLNDAIIAANSNADAGGCVGSGAYGDDTIFLQADVTLASRLPKIESVISIEGNGHFISGNKDANVDPVFFVLDIGRLTLNQVAVQDGGVGIYNYGTVTLTNSTVSDHTVSADSYNGGNGGGIYNRRTLILINSTVSGNTANSGGGIYNEGTVTLTNSIVSGNTANYGGGISGKGAVILTDSTVSGNTAFNIGGGIEDNGGSVELTNSTVSGNMAGYGGGISSKGMLILENSTVSENRASYSSGGIRNFGVATLLHSTVSGNVASSGSGGGIFNAGQFRLQSSIVSGNTNGASGREIYNGGKMYADSFNLFGHSGETSAQAFSSFIPSGIDRTATSDGTQPTALDAILSPLDDNGGPTQTNALVAGSPAIDLDAACSTGVTADQRGITRPSGSGCDAGAYEFDSTPTGVDDIDDDFVFDLYDNCPYIYNPEQEDSDNDGVGDVCDNCPQLANRDQKDIDRDKIGDACDQSVLSGSGSKNLLPVYKLLLLK